MNGYWNRKVVLQLGFATVFLSGLKLPVHAMLVVPVEDACQASNYHPNDNWDAVDQYLKKSLAIQHIPGMSVAIVKNGEVVKATAYGYASIELEAAATPETVYELASSTKPFVSIAILMLRRDGKLQLDDPIEKHLVGLPQAWAGVNIRHLLTHTSGIKDYVNDIGHNFPHFTSIAEVIDRLGREPLSFDPGSKWSYSNTGYVLLSAIVEKHTGKPYDKFLDERVFVPLGMSRTRRDSVDEIIPHRASLYVWNGWEMRNGEFLKHQMMNHGDRGLVSNVLDLAKFERVFQSDSLLNDDDRREMWTEVVLNDQSRFGYGLGWFLGSVQGHRHFSHAGGSPGAAAMISHYPDDDLTIIVLANGGATYPQGLQLGIARHYIDDLKLDVRTIEQSELESIEGYYNLFGSQILKAKISDGGILLSDGNRLEGLCMPVQGESFVALDANRSFEALRNDSNAVVSLELKLGAIEFAAAETRIRADRIGPLLRSLPKKVDSSPIRTQRVVEALQALATGGKALEQAVGVASETKVDFSPGPLPELSGFQLATYLGEVELPPGKIERHRTAVSRVLYLSMQKQSNSQAMLVWLTKDELVADVDLLSE